MENNLKESDKILKGPIELTDEEYSKLAEEELKKRLEELESADKSS